MKSGNLNFLGPTGPLQACNGTALPLPFTVDQDICHILWNPMVHYHFHHLPSSSYNYSAHFQAMASTVFLHKSLICLPAACQLSVLCISAASFPTLSTQLFFCFSAGLLPQIFLSRICFGILL